jgi:hypothetical protein
LQTKENNFIKRKFKNLLTNDIVDFSSISKIHMKMPLGGTGFENVHQSIIAIILGEPASGKTYQLHEYNKQNQESKLLVLSTLRATDTIDNAIEVVLIDSIDEALTNNNRKSLARDLVEFIARCKKINKNVRFVITCRHLEWDKYFKQELQTIDKELREYEILPLDKTDINILLKIKEINEELFWQFIEENFLEQMLGNIIIVEHLLETFDNHKKESVNYTTIYNEIVKKNLIKKGEDREPFTKDIPLDRMILIASSIFTYMLLNNKQSISKSDLEIVASELYKVEDTPITYSELAIVLNTEVFKKVDDGFTFTHKTIQEYLTAYFINSKNFDINSIEKLLAHESRFLENYEEVVIYLTNMESKLFNDFLNFDPFIFRRHPSLNQEEQHKLFLAVINKLQNEEYKLYGKWNYLDGTSIVKYAKLTNLQSLVKSNIEITNINLLTFTFVLKLLEFNYNEELEDFIFDILESIKDKKKFISYIIIDNYAFNLRLLDFLYTNDLLEKNLHSIRSFETKLFQSLYGIDFQYDGKTICNYTNTDIVKLFNLLEYIPSNDLKDITPYIQPEDIEKWFQYLKSNYDEKIHNTEYITWFVYSLLKNRIDIYQIVDFLSRNRILSLHFHTKDIELSFNEIDIQLWEVFFKSQEYLDYRFVINDLLSFYNINLDDIKQLNKEYPISNFPDRYIYFRTRIKDVDQLLMVDETFEQYFHNLIKTQKENEKRWKKDWKNKNPELVEKQKQQKMNTKKVLDTLEQLYQNSILNFTTKNDFYNIFNTLFKTNYNDLIELNNQAKIDLKDKYIPFIEKLKDIFKNDITYLILKDNITSTSVSNTETFMFIYLFNILPYNENDLLINTKEDYTKLFWHLYRYSDYMNSDFFQKISKKYFSELEMLSIEVIQLSLEQSENKIIGINHKLKKLFTNLDAYNKISLSNLITYLKSIPEKKYSILQNNEKEIFLEILALDEDNFDFIKNMMLDDKDKCHIYLHYLLLIDKNLAIKYFNKFIYNKISKKRSLLLIAKTFFGFYVEDESTKYNNPKINPKKIQKFLCFMNAMKRHTFEDVDSITLKMIITDYYQFFDDYITTSQDIIFDDVYSKINNLWRYLESTIDHIELLKELSISEINNIYISANYSLDIVYKLQAKERKISNSFYKEIFDKKTTVEHKTINNYGNYAENNTGKMSVKQGI